MFKKKRSTREMVQGKSSKTESATTASSLDNDFDVSIEETSEKPKRKSEFKKHRFDYGFVRSKLFWGIASTVFALLIAFAGVPSIISEVGKTVEVITFSQDVSAGSLITADMLEYKQMTAYNLPSNAVLDIDQINGRYLTHDAVHGDIVTSLRLSSTYPGSSPELANLPKGKLAVSFTLSELAESVSSKLQAGDIIQIFAVLDSNKESGDLAAQMPPELQCVKVLSVTSSEGIDVNESGDIIEDPSVISTVTVEVTRQQASILIGLEHMATLHAGLVVRGDDSLAAQALAQQEALMAPESEQSAEETPHVPNESSESLPEPTESTSEDIADTQEGGAQ